MKLLVFSVGAVLTPVFVGGAQAQLGSNDTLRPPRAATSFWYANLDRRTPNVRGYAPDLDGDESYAIYKEVLPSGGGEAIQEAINAGTNGARRHGQWFASQPRVVYLPPGEYIVSKTIEMNTDTVLMGDATNPPVLKAATGFTGNKTLVSGQDPTTGISGELSFTVGLKNLVLDTTNIAGGDEFTALYWGVAQGSQLQNVKIRMPPSSHGTGHSGIKLGRGSTLGLSDVRIEGGQNGIWHDGHQQALYKSIYFYQNAVGMLITGGSTISLVGPTFDTVGIAVHQIGGYPWIGIIDAKSINSGVTFITATWPSFLIENLVKDTSSDIVQGPGEYVYASQPHLNRLSYGNTVGRDPIYGPEDGAHTRPSALLTPDGRYPAIPAPNYADRRASDFLNVKDPAQNGGRRIYGDNTRDEAAALNAILKLAAQRHQIAYFPFGKYRVESTLHIPPGSRIVGEAWATITGQGAFFQNAESPQPVVQVGNPGDVGVAHIQDMRFTVGEILPGAIIVQFHLAGRAPGDVAIWNSLVTVGGVRGAPGVTDACVSAEDPCRAAFLGMHFSPTSSVYVENMWNWVADHITEKAEGSPFDGGSRIAAGRGALVEATRGTWLHALGSEHWWLYQLQLRQADNVFVSMLQSETNYDQGDNNPLPPPAPWTADVAGWGDPDFDWCGSEDDKRCRMGPSNYISSARNVYHYASASWAFFSGPGYQPCAGPFQCQKYMHMVQGTSENLQLFGLCSKDAYATLRLADGTEIVTSEGFTGSWPGGGGDVGRYTS